MDPTNPSLSDFFTGYFNFGVSNAEMAVVLWSVLAMYLLPSIIATIVVVRSWRSQPGAVVRHRRVVIPVFHHRHRTAEERAAEDHRRAA